MDISNLEILVFKIIEDFSPWKREDIKVSRPNIEIYLIVIRDNVAMVTT